MVVQLGCVHCTQLPLNGFPWSLRYTTYFSSYEQYTSWMYYSVGPWYAGQNCWEYQGSALPLLWERGGIAWSNIESIIIHTYWCTICAWLTCHWEGWYEELLDIFAKLYSSWRECSSDPYLTLQVNSGAGLLRVVRTDLADVVLVCEAKKKQTNYLRSLISDLAKGVYAVCGYVTLWLCKWWLNFFPQPSYWCGCLWNWCLQYWC